MIAPLQNGTDENRPASKVIVVDIGNTSIDVALWTDGHVTERSDSRHGDMDVIGDAIRRRTLHGEQPVLTAVAVSSVVPAALEILDAWIRDRLEIAPLIIGRRIPLPMPVKLPHPEAVGVDRVCSAAAAYHVKQEPCVVVDFGTAVTVDMVDGEGAFVGGAIAPGLRMQARALHEHTAVLPEIRPELPHSVIGQDTADAIRGGIVYGTAGAVRHIVERYAEHIGRWPPVIATGGDATLMADVCAIFDDVVPDLCLMGVGLAYQRWLDAAVTI